MTDLAEAVLSYERSTLPEHTKAALRLADAFLFDPSGPREVDAQLRPSLSAAQTVELVLKLVAFSANKTTVALDVDGPASPRGLSTLRYDDGVAVVTPA